MFPIGTHTCALSCCSNSAFWIIDSDVFDHITSHSHPFTSYSLCSGNEKIKIAYGSFLTIAGKG